MSGREPIDETARATQVEHVAAAPKVDASEVSPHAVHDLAGRITARYQRPMTPAFAYLRGLTIAIYPNRDPGELAQVILNMLLEN